MPGAPQPGSKDLPSLEFPALLKLRSRMAEPKIVKINMQARFTRNTGRIHSPEGACGVGSVIKHSDLGLHGLAKKGIDPPTTFCDDQPGRIERLVYSRTLAD